MVWRLNPDAHDAFKGSGRRFPFCSTPGSGHRVRLAAVAWLAEEMGGVWRSEFWAVNLMGDSLNAVVRH